MYRVGDQILLEFRFAVAGSLVDPTQVSAEVERPDATVDELSAARVEQGRYQVTLIPTAAGQHVVTCAGTGEGARTHSDVVNVAPARSTALASLADLKAHLNIVEGQHADDEELRAHLESATVVVEQHTGQTVARRTITGERHHVPLGGRLVLDHHPVLSITSLSSPGRDLLWSPDVLEVDRATGEICPGGGMTIVGNVDATYVAGYAAVPPNMSLAALIIAAHLWETQRHSAVVRTDEAVTPLGAGFAVPNRAVELLGGRPPRIA